LLQSYGGSIADCPAGRGELCEVAGVGAQSLSGTC